MPATFSNGLFFAVAAFACTWFPQDSRAQKPSKPGGGGGTTTAFHLVDLGGLSGGPSVQAWATSVNNPDAAGWLQVVGYSLTAGRAEHAVLGPGEGLVTLPGFGGGSGLPSGLNDTGTIVGSAPDSAGQDHGALWQIDEQGQVAGPVDLGEFFPADVNDGGLLAGNRGLAAAIAWLDQGSLQVQLLGALDPLGSTEAIAVNDNGMVVGNATDRTGFREAFVWTSATGMVGLGKFSGL